MKRTIEGSPKLVAKLFGCTEEQARRQYAENASDLSRMAQKAESTGRKVNGYTAQQLRDMSERMRLNSL